MRSAAWISLVQIVPPELAEKLVAVMSSGNEINITRICRMEQDFMVVQGRLAGTTDDASIVFIPYEQIDYLGFRIPMKDAELEAMFKNPSYQVPPPAPVMAAMAPTPIPISLPAPAPIAPAAAATPPPAPIPAAPVPTPVPTPAPTPAPAGAGSISTILPGKAALLERLRRSRLNQDSPKSREG